MRILIPIQTPYSIFLIAGSITWIILPKYLFTSKLASDWWIRISVLNSGSKVFIPQPTKCAIFFELFHSPGRFWRYLNFKFRLLIFKSLFHHGRFIFNLQHQQEDHVNEENERLRENFENENIKKQKEIESMRSKIALVEQKYLVSMLSLIITLLDESLT